MKANQNLKSTAKFSSVALMLLMVVAIIPSGYMQQQFQAFAASSNQNIIFTNVSADPNLVPNKQFKVSATVHNTDSNSRQVQVTISVPSDVSVAGSVVADLGSLPSDREATATWTLIAGKTGSFPVTMTAYSTDPDSGDGDSAEFLLNLSVGSKGLAITQMNVPGSIVPNHEFQVVIKLKNMGSSDITNVISQLAVPAGLQALDGTSQNISLIKADEEVALTWNIKAVNTGSYTIAFSYNSKDAGSDSLTANVNVGINTIAELKPTQVIVGSDSSQSIPMRPGDRDLPLKVVLANSGTIDLHDITATLKLAKPFSWSYFSNGDRVEKNIQSFSIASVEVGKTAEALYYVSIDESAESGLYIHQLTLSFFDGNQQIERTYDVPLQISPNIILSVSSTKVDVEPGYVSSIVFDITNNGQEAVHGLSVSSLSSSSSPAAPDSPFSTVDSPVWVGDLGVGATKTVTMKVYTAPEAVTVSPLKLIFSYQSGGISFQQPQGISLNIQGQPSFAVNTAVKADQGAIYAGDTGARIDLDIVNTGYALADDVSVKLNLPSGFSPAWGDSDSMYIGKILSGQSATASFFVNIDNAVSSGNYPLALEIKHSKGQATMNVNFIVAAKARFELVSISDSALYAGATNAPLKAVIRNIGSSTAQTITTNFLGGNNLPGVRSNTLTSVGNTEYIGDTVPGQSFTTTFIVNVDPTSPTGSQTTTIEIDWTQDGSKTFSQTVAVPIHISNGAPYLLYYQGVPWTYIIIIGVLTAGLISFLILRRRKIAIIEPGIREIPPHAIQNDLPAPASASSKTEKKQSIVDDEFNVENR